MENAKGKITEHVKAMETCGEPNYLLGSFNGLPACVDTDGNLHICAANFPDKKFLYFIANNISHTNKAFLTREEVATVETLNLSFNGITDLTGIGYFTALTKLKCRDNKLKTLDLENNNMLTSLDCGCNKLVLLNISNNKELVELDCSENKLKSMCLENNTMIKSLVCYLNQITALDCSNNNNLTVLRCADNKLISLNIGNNKALTDLDCSHNQLTSLDVKNDKKLKKLDCEYNQLTELNVDSNKKLIVLVCNNNQLTSLNLQLTNVIGCNASGQVREAFKTERFNSWEVDLGAIIGKDENCYSNGARGVSNAHHVIEINNGILDEDTGIITYSREPEYASYKYDTGIYYIPMDVTLYLSKANKK